MKNLFKPGLTVKTAFLTATLLCITFFAVGIGLYSFHQYQLALATITGPQLNLLRIATKLVQQSDAIISSSSTLLLAADQFERRRALFELADRAAWMDKLIEQLQQLGSASERFRGVIQAKENLIKNLHELDTLIEQRIALSPTTSLSPANLAKTTDRLADINRELNSVIQKNKLYSTELGIAVGFHVARVKDAIVDKAAALEALMRERRRYLIAAAALSVTAVLAIALYIQLAIVKRIVSLQQAVNGDRVLPSEIPITGSDEISKLATTVKRYIEKSIIDEAHILTINRELSFLATYDSLTKLYNRQHFEKIAGKLTSSPGIHFCISIIDIDHFKCINDTYGHKTGDLALAHLAATIKSGLRNTDILARYGGEEFVILMLTDDQTVAFNVVERIRHMIETSPLQTQSGPIFMTASFGVAQRLGDDQGVDDCIRCADMALYAAKNNGRNTVTLYTPDLSFPCET